MMRESGKVYIVGAGCGAADLITLRGLRLLQRCGAVVYDDLIDEELLAYVPVDAERIYMGKRRGRHSAPQEEINETLISLASRGLDVVRLKGGDPFVFGRAGEEILALREAGIGYETVPGISSCIAMPAEAGIPVTHRGVSRSFHVLTAHSAGPADTFPEELDRLAALQGCGTIVILMGLSRLREIADRLIASGMDPETPAAVVSGGNAEYPAAVRAVLSGIADAAEQASVRPPAVIVIGRTAGMDLRPYTNTGDTAEYAARSTQAPASGDRGGSRETGPEREPRSGNDIGCKSLRGVTVGITGTDVIRTKLRAGLEARGAAVIDAERSLLERIRIPSSAWAAVTDGKPHRIVFTSVNGVEEFFRQGREQSVDLRRFAACRFAVIGAATGAALAAHGIMPEICPEEYTGAGLAKALLADLTEEERDAGAAGRAPDIWLFRSRRGSRELAAALAQSCEVHDIAVYDLHADNSPDPQYRTGQSGSMDFLTFASGSGVELYLERFGSIPDGVRCVCIGEQTAEILRERAGREPAVAPEISAEGIIQAVLSAPAER